MLFAPLKYIHLLAVILWLGGMAFSHFFLRPAAQTLEPAARVPLMHAVLKRFFAAMLVTVAVVLLSGAGMVASVYHMASQAGLRFQMPLSWHVMAALGLVMAGIFGHIRFALFKRLDRAVQSGDWPAGGKALASIRVWVAGNLALGVAIITALRLAL
ncbi:CopD family protein [Comamonas antarctica]|uniref:CopD family protein n=1 Tax=Comamonas antarctica TaxID=2743470 RepID=A0A6N1X0M0_9BURK|nr:CopD family protein [Comamonas antarctica]QKV52974.1 CopD family protein [Comamonas antarctica]